MHPVSFMPEFPDRDRNHVDRNLFYSRLTGYYLPPRRRQNYYSELGKFSAIRRADMLELPLTVVQLLELNKLLKQEQDHRDRPLSSTSSSWHPQCANKHIWEAATDKQGKVQTL